MEVKIENIYKVKIYEMDSWSGEKLIDNKYFDNDIEAISFTQKYNEKNDKKIVPEYYTYAEYYGKV